MNVSEAAFADDVLRNCAPASAATSRASASVARPRRPPATFVPLVSGGAGAPLILLHPAMPTPWCYKPLVEHATWDRPVYAARGAELDHDYAVFGFDELVTQYYIDIRLLQPTGPYLLGGWSLGGVLAFEIARKLVADGQDVQRLVMFDTYPPPGRLQRMGRRGQLLALDLLRVLAQCEIGRSVLDRMGWTSPLAKAILLLRFDRPLSAGALREILDAAFPGLSASLADASFEELCDVLVERVRPLIPEIYLKDVDRLVATGRSVDFVRFHQLQWKNHWLGVCYRARGIYSGQITVYAAQNNRRVSGWQRFSPRPVDIRRVAVAPSDGLNTHLAFFNSANVKLFAEDLSRLVRGSVDPL